MLLCLPSLKCDEPAVPGELLTPSSWKGTSPGLLQARSCTRLGSTPANANQCTKHEWVLEICFSHSSELLDPGSKA